ncbi:GNAT family N-acetyltransferase [Stappia sp. GBMRC 2046]|uniref:GNAT family N-acetyltransferase n=1 Tax=Stappia sediminis TaxID=2692190 RepID=A0A7X3LV99_9HYPH|nr:N-acetyltransferase [Stappia sediminis]MXN65780.1 GNAT family N-acetyltransferase [Stappia sediminis]
MIEIRDEALWDHDAREELLDRAFGLSRFEKTSERLREGRVPAIALSAFRHDGDGRETLVASVRLWNAETADGRPVLLLGPLAVDESCRGFGIGARLMRTALNRAAVAGHSAVVLVGDAPYYGRFGFSSALTLGLDLPGPVERERFLALELAEGALDGAMGCLCPTGLLGDASVAASDEDFDALFVRPWPPAR